MPPLLVLVVEDDAVVRESCQQTLERSGWRVVTACDGFSALKALRLREPDLVVLDLKMPGMDGIDLLQHVRADRPQLDVIVITAYSSVGSAVECMRLGAYDYLPKPFEPDALRLAVGRALEKRRLAEENRALRMELADSRDLLVGESTGMRRVRDLIERVAPSDSTVLVLGESGTGKELVARAVHRQSPRRGKPFVTVDCGSLAESVCESELFGHVKGAFTGATNNRAGRFELADGGTVFLDEIGNVVPAIQAKLLRVLQEREIARVGSSEAVAVDVRIIAATNQDLEAARRAGSFREDLYYRLSVVQIAVPPLRARLGDIPLLADCLIRRLADRRNLAPRPLSPEGLDVLMRHTWPGNVRELENVLERALLLAEGAEIGARDLEPVDRRVSAAARPDDDDLSLATMERLQIRRALDAAGGRVGEAAALLGIDRKTLRRKIHDLDRG
jgi:two-component system, NtrC family, response regulator HydG